MLKFAGLARSEAGLSLSSCYSTSEASWLLNTILAKARPVFHRFNPRGTPTKERWMTLRGRTLPELEVKAFCGAKYLGLSYFHSILWIQSYSRLGIDAGALG